MKRRGFLGAMLAAAAAPAFVKAGILMPVRKIVVPEMVMPSGRVIWGDGIHDDTDALQAAFDGEPVVLSDGRAFAGLISGGTYKVSQTLRVRKTSANVVIENAHFDGQAIKQGAVVHFDWDSEFAPGGISITAPKPVVYSNYATTQPPFAKRLLMPVM